MREQTATLLHESSKYLRKHVQDANKDFPAPWRGNFLRYKWLEDELHGKGADSRGEEFLVSVCKEVANVNRVFATSAGDILRLRRPAASPNWLGTVVDAVRGKKKRGEGEDPRSFRAGACLEYAHINAVALRRILNQHDRTHGSNLGRKYYDSLWRNQTGSAAFLHSPELLELSAIAQTPQPQHRSQAVDEDEGVGCGVNPTVDARADSVKLDHRCSVCLEVLFKPVALGCGHVFCTSCSKTAAGRMRDVRAFDQVARCVDPSVRCPVCRQVGVFRGAAELTALGDTIRARYPQHWETRGREEAAREVELKGELLRKLGGSSLV